jgi:hypothetical protein
MARPEHLNRALYAVYSAQVRNRLKIVNPIPDVRFRDDDVFSKMHYRAIVDGGNATIEFFEYIEPLVGILRDPLTMCNHFSNVLTEKVRMD